MCVCVWCWSEEAFTVCFPLRCDMLLEEVFTDLNPHIAELLTKKW